MKKLQAMVDPEVLTRTEEPDFFRDMLLYQEAQILLPIDAERVREAREATEECNVEN